MIIEGRQYSVVMGSDLERDGMFLELYLGADYATDPIAECFYSDRDASITLTEYVPGVAVAALTWLHSEAAHRLPPMIQVDAYREDIIRTLDEVGLRGCTLEVVDSVREWAKSVGVEETNHARVAMALLADGNPLIVIKSEITPNDRSRVIGRMVLDVFDTELSRIRLPEAFLEHLVLHEAAHLLLPDGASEEECDRWAFEHLSSRIPRRTA